MRIITVNLDDASIEELAKLSGSGEDRLYPSRSEAIRVAVREFLTLEISRIKAYVESQKIENPQLFQDESNTNNTKPITDSVVIIPGYKQERYTLKKRE